MNIVDILSTDILNIPVTRGNKDIRNFTYRYLSDYLKLVKEIDNFKIENSYEFQGKPCNQFLVEIVEKFINGINSAINNYLEGSASKAYNVLTESFLFDSNNIFRTIIHLLYWNCGQDTYYRIFNNKENKSITKELLFHIPFDEIEKVKTQRYSISGFPCLYLGSNVFTCVKELDLDLKDEDLRNILLSKFEVSRERTNIQNILLMDLRIKKTILYEKYISNNDSDFRPLILYLLVFPLIFSTSLKVSKQNESFMPEYIISQLLIQWILNEAIYDGIMYSSSKIHDYDIYYNVVIPPKQIYSSGQCPHRKRQLIYSFPKSFYECLENPTKFISKIDITISEKVEEFINKPKTLYVF